MCSDRRLLEQLNTFRDSSTLIVGIGNTLKGDDAAGPLVCEQLSKAQIAVELIDAGTVPENYIQTVVKKAPENLLVIDAIDFGATVGTIRIFEPEQLSSHAISTHTLSPHLFVDMICRQLELSVYFIGIQPAQTKMGQSVSPQVSRAVQWLSRALVEVFAPK